MSRLRLPLAFVASMTACASAPTAPVVAMHPASSSAQPSPQPAPPPAREPWCKRMPELTEDASGDQTGRANDLGRVSAVHGRIQWDLIACGGVVGVGITVDWIAEALLHHTSLPQVSRPVAPSDPSYVLRVMLVDERRLPTTNPLYFDGVRVYFEATGPIDPL